MIDYNSLRRPALRTVLGLALLAALAGVSTLSLAGDDFWSGDFGDRPFHLEHDSLLISSSTYDRTKGALASLNIGTTLPNSATATTTAVASNNYVTVWNNAVGRRQLRRDIADRS